MKKKTVWACSLLVMVLLFSGCKPRVTYTAPRNGATEVAGNVVVTAYFNSRIDNTTLDMALACDNASVAGTVAILQNASGKNDRAVFTPEAFLHSGNSCTATIAAGLKSSDTGGVMRKDYSWVFTIDDVPPELVSITDSGTVAPGMVPVNMHFNETIASIDFSFDTAYFSPHFTNNGKTVTVRALNLVSGNTYHFKLEGFADAAGNYTPAGNEVVLTVQ
jgi:hypothetical protein